MNIAEIREKYPQYSDLSDEQLARGLHAKHYSDLNFDDFSQRIGLSKEPTLTEQTFDQSKQSFLNPLGAKGAITGEGEDLVNQVGQGATFGFLDEAQAGLYAALGVGLPESLGGLPEGVGYSEAYKGIREEIRGKNKAFEEENPKTAVAAQVGGGLASGGLSAIKTLDKVGDVAALADASKKTRQAVQAAKVAGVAGAQGAVAGAGYSEGDTLGEIAEDSAKGATVGALVGAGGQLAVKGAKEVAKSKAARKIAAEASETVESLKNESKELYDQVKSESLTKQAYGKMLLDVERNLKKAG